MTSFPSMAPAAAAAPPSPEEQRQRHKIAAAAQSFEASFLSNMMQTMFDGVDVGAFGGGDGEKAFKSFLTDAIAKQTAKAGGVGISAEVNREMLKLQGLS